MPIGTPFKKGNTAGKGRPKLSNEQKKNLKRLKSFDGKTLLAKYSLMTHESLKNFISQGDTNTCLELLVAKVIDKGIERCDINILSYLFTRFGWDEAEKDTGRPISINYSVIKNNKDE